MWDGKDIYGRKVQGAAGIVIRIGYVYSAVYLTPDEIDKSFAGVAGQPISGSEARQEITIWQEEHDTLGTFDARALGVGGWTLSVQHVYDPVGQVLYRGDGATVSSVALPTVITTIAGQQPTNADNLGDGGPAKQAKLAFPTKIASGPDGSIYIVDAMHGLIRRIASNGVITTVAGGGRPADNLGDGLPATQAALAFGQEGAVAVASDGSLYIGSFGRVRRVGPDGIITTLAGGGKPADGVGDGLPATQAALGDASGVAIGPDGSLYIADIVQQRIRRVGADGIISTVAGNGKGNFGDARSIGDGGPATQAELTSPFDVAVGPDGSLYIPEAQHVRRVAVDGIITTVAGSTTSGIGGVGDGGPATQAALGRPEAVAVGPDGTLYISDKGDDGRIRQVDPTGIITTIAGGISSNFNFPDSTPATTASFAAFGIAVLPDGSLVLGNIAGGRIQRVAPALPGLGLGDFVLASQDGREVYAFNKDGRHLKTVDALTGAVRYAFTYDSAGRLTAVTDGNGNVTTIQRDAGGNPASIVAPAGQKTTLTLDANGYLTSLHDPAGESVALTSTMTGLLSTFTDARLNAHHFSYDSLGRLSRDEDPAGGVLTLARTATVNGFKVSVSTIGGEVTTHETDFLPKGEVMRVHTDAAGGKTVDHTLTDSSRTTTFTDGTRVVVQFAPDPRWGMQAPHWSAITRTAPSGRVETFTHTQTATLADPNNPLSLQTLTSTDTINGNTSTAVYDAASHTITNTLPAGIKLVSTIDSSNRLLQQKVAGIALINYTYDPQGRLSTVTDGSGADRRSLSLTYNNSGFLDTLVGPMGTTYHFSYDATGRIAQATLPGNRVVQYVYDASGNLTSITPPGRPAHAFTFNPVSLLSSYTAPDIGPGKTQTLYTYDNDRQLTRVTLPGGQTIDLVLDSAGRLSTVTTPDGQFSVAYDSATGQLARLRDPDGISLSYTYDGSRLKGTAWGGPIAGSVNRTYDNNFRVSALSVNGGKPIAFQHDANNLLASAGDLTLTRDPENGLLTGSTLAKVTDALTYNGFGEPTSYSVSQNGSVTYSVQYTRDGLGRITQKTETIGGITDTYQYTYDEARRLIQVQKNGNTVAAYTYDGNGNRRSATEPNSTVTATHDNQDRLLTYGRTSYGYAANGSLSSKTANGQTSTYQYDVLGNLKSVTLPDGTRLEYLVDGQNRRLGKKVNGVLVQGFLYQDLLRPVAELDGNGQVVSTFIYAGLSNVPAYMIKGGAVYRIVTDQVGSPRLVIDAATGQVVQRMDYDAFGKLLMDTNPGFQPFGFAGGLYDRDTRLVRFGARDYDAEIGRFTAKDPIQFGAGSFNFYGYAKNDPVNFKDRTGRASEAVAEGFRIFASAAAAAAPAVVESTAAATLVGGLGVAAEAIILGIPIAAVLIVGATLESSALEHADPIDDEGPGEGGAPSQNEVDAGPSSCPAPGGDQPANPEAPAAPAPGSRDAPTIDPPPPVEPFDPTMPPPQPGEYVPPVPVNYVPPAPKVPTFPDGLPQYGHDLPLEWID